jgi:hypothetical protein
MRTGDHMYSLNRKNRAIKLILATCASLWAFSGVAIATPINPELAETASSGYIDYVDPEISNENGLAIATSKIETDLTEIQSLPPYLESKPVTPDNFHEVNGEIVQMEPGNSINPKVDSSSERSPNTSTIQSIPTTSSDLVLENVQIDSSYLYNSFFYNTFKIEPSFRFRLPNGNKITFRTGYNFLSQDPFRQPNLRPLNIILTPLQLGWEGQVGMFTLKADAKVNIYDKLPTTLSILTSATVPIFPNVFLTGKYEQVALESTPSSLEQGITARNYGPTLFWQIDPDMTFFSTYTITNYNDGNRGQQTYSKLERKFGQFSLSGNVVTWGSDRFADAYFSAPDFLIYTAGFGWEGDITSYLNLTLQAYLGGQRFNGDGSSASYYVARLTSKISENVDAFFEYTYGDLKNTPGGQRFIGNVADLYNQTYLTFQLKAKF